MLHKSTARASADSLPGNPRVSWEGWMALSRVPTAARLPFVSVVEPQAKLNRSCLVALRVDGAKRGGAPVRVRAAEGRPVEDVAGHGLEPHPQVPRQLEALGKGQVLLRHPHPPARPHPPPRPPPPNPPSPPPASPAHAVALAQTDT